MNLRFYILLGSVINRDVYIFMFTEGLRTVPSVGEWLEGADLIQYENIFMVNGFDDMRFMVREVFTFKTRNFSLNAPD